MSQIVWGAPAGPGADGPREGAEEGAAPGARRPRVRLPSTTDAVVDGGFAAATTVLAAAGFGSVFAGRWWLVVCLLGVTAGLAVAVACAVTRQLGVVLVAGLVVAAALLSGVVLPGSGRYGLPTPTSVRDVLLHALDGWAEILTVLPPLPARSPSLAVPFAACLVVSALSWSLARRTGRPGTALLPPVVLLCLGILLGTGEPPALLLQGGGLAVLGLFWLTLQRERQVRQNATSPLRRPVALAVTLAAAAAAAVAVAPLLPASGRFVLREEVTPPFEPVGYPSPLATFRTYALDPDRTLFAVRGLPAGQRIRLAALDDYDGLVWNVAAAEGTGGRTSGRFDRLGSFAGGAGDGGRTVRVGVTGIDLPGPWLPSVGGLVGARPTGPAVPEPALYLNAATGTLASPGATQVTGLREDVLPATPPSWAEVAATAGAMIDPVVLPAPRNVPDSVEEFADDVVGEENDPIAQIDLLRAALVEGYYSDGTTGQTASLPGHGAARLEHMLRDEDLVGDDEQYAAALALMLRSRDIPARVVVGFRPGADDAPADDEAVGGSVEVTGADAAAWVEVPVAGVGWVPVDATPPRDRVLPQRSPTPEDRPETDNHPVPPPPQDQQVAPERIGDAPPPPAAPDRHSWLAGLVAVLRLLGLGLLVLAPLLLVVLAKAVRRRWRRHHGAPGTRIRRGWIEVCDLSRDLGRRPPGRATRREQAAMMPVVDAASLADRADAAAFGPERTTASDAARAWGEIEELRRRTLDGLSRGRRLRALLNPASLIRR